MSLPQSPTGDADSKARMRNTVLKKDCKHSEEVQRQKKTKKVVSLAEHIEFEQKMKDCQVIEDNEPGLSGKQQRKGTTQSIFQYQDMELEEEQPVQQVQKFEKFEKKQKNHIRQYPLNFPKHYLSLRFGKRAEGAIEIARVFAYSSKSLRQIRKDFSIEPRHSHCILYFRNYTRHIFASTLRKICRLLFMTCKIEIDYDQLKHWQTNYSSIFDLGVWMPEKDIIVLKKVIKSQFDFSHEPIYIFQLIDLLLTLQRYEKEQMHIRENCLQQLQKIKIDRSVLAVKEPSCKQRKNLLKFRFKIATEYMKVKNEELVFKQIKKRYPNYLFTLKEISESIKEALCLGLRKIIVCNKKSETPYSRVNIGRYEMDIFIKKLLQTDDIEMKCLCIEAFLTPVKFMWHIENYQQKLKKFCLRNIIKLKQ